MKESVEETIARIEERIAYLEKAILVAHTALERRLEGMNEFREQLKDQASRFVTRNELWTAAITVLTLSISIAALVIKLIS